MSENRKGGFFDSHCIVSSELSVTFRLASILHHNRQCFWILIETNFGVERKMDDEELQQPN